jgi:hypothetical protein
MENIQNNKEQEGGNKPDQSNFIPKIALNKCIPNKYGVCKKKPPLPNLLLSNIDIRDVLKQWQDYFNSKNPNHYISYGAVPCDFFLKGKTGECNDCKFVDKFDICTSQYKYISIVVNTDKFGESGIHWVTILFEKDFKNGIIKMEYFDSLGTKTKRSYVESITTKSGYIIPKFIYDYYLELKKSVKKCGIKIVFTYNKTQHQFDDHMCGVYCVYFSIMRIAGNKYEDNGNTIPFSHMLSMKHILFDSDQFCSKCHKFKDKLRNKILKAKEEEEK